MRTLIAILLLSVAVITATPVGPSMASVQSAATKASGTVDEVKKPIDRDLLGLITWATGRFANAGLELPPFRVEQSAIRESCGGNMAIAIHGGAVPTVRLCTDADSSDVAVKRTLLHEIAHVWANDALDTATRAAFLELRGLDAWTDADRWEERGSEHAAEVMTWALMDVELTMLTLPDHDPVSLTVAWETLTGRALPVR